MLATRELPTPGGELAKIVAAAQKGVTPDKVRPPLGHVSDADRKQIIELYKSAKNEVEDNREMIAALRKRNISLKPASTLVGIAEKFGVGRGTVLSILQGIKA